MHLPFAIIRTTIHVLPLAATMDFSILEFARVNAPVANLPISHPLRHFKWKLNEGCAMSDPCLVSQEAWHTDLSAFAVSPSVDQLPRVFCISEQRVAEGARRSHPGAFTSESTPLSVDADCHPYLALIIICHFSGAARPLHGLCRSDSR